MDTKEKISGNAYLFEIATFLVMCAKESLDPTCQYAPLRMLDAIEKLADFPQYVLDLKEDSFLQHIKLEIEEAGDLVMNDPEAFQNFMDRLVDQFVEEMKKRSYNE
ncbi:MAG: DUF6092 family protein [Candidatus Hodarchaeota archaeon]